MQLNSKGISRKAYNRPNLLIYGDISQLTQNNASPNQNCDNHKVVDAGYCGSAGATKTGYNM